MNYTHVDQVLMREHIRKDPFAVAVWKKLAPVWVKNGWLSRTTLPTFEALVGMKANARRMREMGDVVTGANGKLYDRGAIEGSMWDGIAQRFEDLHCSSPVN